MESGMKQASNDTPISDLARTSMIMSQGLKLKPQSHLINILKETRDHHPNFALFLGAGASVTSGVSPTSQLIEVWRDSAHKNYGNASESLDAYLARQPWFNQAEEYSVLFELLYDEPSQRREFIEKCIANAKPSWGYIYLVNLLRNSAFNTIFTTNFDDLLNEACYQFSTSVRPIVCAHDSSIRSVRITSKRPKIIKLHGDFLFDNIKNTLSELESLEENMREKFKQYATEFGLIVVGYSGNDRSIMDSLAVLLRHEVNFPHGVYWCIRKGTKVSRNVEMLQRFPKFKLIEIEGFDEFFAEITSALDLELQPELADPYTALANKFNNLIGAASVPEKQHTHKIIERDIERIGAKIAELARTTQKTLDVDDASDVNIKVGSEIVKLPLPYELLAQVAVRQNQFAAAMKYQLHAIDAAPTAKAFSDALQILANGDVPELLVSEFFDRIGRYKNVILQNPFLLNNASLMFISQAKYVMAERLLARSSELVHDLKIAMLNELHEINRLQIKLHRHEELSDADRKSLQELAEHPDEYIRVGAMILLGNVQKAYELLDRLIATKKLGLDQFNQWPIKKLLPERFVDDPSMPAKPAA
jgi:tetratricopeptide (TPR) repeat protein